MMLNWHPKINKFSIGRGESCQLRIIIAPVLLLALVFLISSCGSPGTASTNPLNGLADFQFKKYYLNDFTEPGIGGLDTPVLSGAADFNQADASFPNVYYSSGLGKYIMVFNMVVWKEFNDPAPTLNGIYYATSDDGIHWGTPVQIICGWSLALGTNEFIWHPSIVWDSDAHLTGYLVYSKGNQNTTHYMVCRQLININPVQLGDEQVILPSNNKFGIQWFPDTVTTVIPGTGSYPFRILLTAGEMGSFLLEVQDLFHLTHCAGPVLYKGAPGSIDNGYAGISGAVVYGTTIYAIYHTEDHENLPGLSGGVPGYFATVSLAKSTDNGYSFTKLGQVVTSQKPKSWEAYTNQADRGAGEPCMVVSKDGNELFLYYVDHSRVNNRGCQIFMAETAKPANPK